MFFIFKISEASAKVAANVDGLLLCWNSLIVQPGTAAGLKN
jgi:hypothetical protein